MENKYEYSLDDYKITFISDEKGAIEKDIIVPAEHLCEQIKILMDSCYTILKVKIIEYVE